MFDLGVGRAAGALCCCLQRSRNSALVKRKIFRMGKGLFVRERVKQNCIAQGNRFQSCTEEKTWDACRGLLDQRILSA